MPEVELNATELAAGAAIARQMDREEGRLLRHHEETGPSGTATAISAVFVAVTSIGMLILMLVLGR